MLQERKVKQRVAAVSCASLIVGIIVTIIMVLVLGFLNTSLPTVFRPLDNSNLLLYNFFISQIFSGAVMIAMHLPFKRYNFSMDKMTVKSFLKYTCIVLGISHLLNFFTTFIVIPVLDTFSTTSSDPIDSLVTSQPVGMLIAFVVILGPIAEELIFRQVILSRLMVIGQRNAIILQGVLFGLYHANLHQFLYTTGMGIVLGYVTVRFGSFKYAVYMHIIMNFAGSIVPLFMLTSEALIAIYGLLILANIIAVTIYVVKKRNAVAFSDDNKPNNSLTDALASPLVIIPLVLLVAYTLLNSL